MTSDDVRYADLGEVRLAYTTTGDPARPPVLLVAGLGGQLISWEDDFCAELVDRGLYVIRFDNRDVGLSTHFGEQSAASTAPPLMPGLPAPVYQLSDLAADAAALVEHLGLDAVHLVGVSMGGMISQLVAINHPERVRSLTSIMSTTGDPEVGEATDEALALLTGPAATTREEFVTRAPLAAAVIGSPAHPTPVEVLHDRAGRAYDRAYDPPGVARQLQAVLQSPDRTLQLRLLDVPTLVIHGAADTLIDVSGGRAAAAAVPGAELIVIDGMGHDLPRALWPRVADAIAGLVRRAEVRSDPDPAPAR